MFVEEKVATEVPRDCGAVEDNMRIRIPKATRLLVRNGKRVILLLVSMSDNQDGP